MHPFARINHTTRIPVLIALVAALPAPATRLGDVRHSPGGGPLGEAPSPMPGIAPGLILARVGSRGVPSLGPDRPILAYVTVRREGGSVWETTEIKHCEAKIGQNSRYEVGAWATLPLQSTVSKLVLPYPQNHRARGSYTVHSGPLSAVCLFSVATAPHYI